MQTCECGQQATKQLSAPMFAVDFPAYQSPTTGKWITGRVQRNEDLKASNCVEYEPSMVAEQQRRHAAEDAALDKQVEDHVEKSIMEMPIEKREKLASEMEHLDVELLRV